MIRVAVISTSILSIGYDPKAQLLEVEFTSHSVYDYFNVPANVYQAFISALSKGRYFDSKIRDVYRTRRIG